MKNGYVEVWLAEDSPYWPMAGKDGYVYEHRLVMAQSLGRPLLRGEEVHHKNGNKHDNRIENLSVLSHAEHAAEPQAELRRLRARVRELEDELAALKASTS